MIPTFASRLRQLRLNINLRQEQVAEYISVSKSVISTYENNTREPSIEILIRLAELYHVSIDYLLGKTNKYSLDISDLSDEEAAAISQMVFVMAKKNEYHKEFRK